MQRIISFLLCLVFLLTICGCKGETENKQPSSSAVDSSADGTTSGDTAMYTEKDGVYVGPGKVFAVVTIEGEKAVIELRNVNKSNEVIKTEEYKFQRPFAK